MVWDNSPTHYTLSTSRNSPQAWSLAPFIPASITNVPPASPRERLSAFSQPPVMRNHAFQAPQSNQAFSTTPSPRPSTRSRIPVPSMPSQGNLDLINDLSNVLPPSRDQQEGRRRIDGNARSDRHQV